MYRLLVDWIRKDQKFKNEKIAKLTEPLRELYKRHRPPSRQQLITKNKKILLLQQEEKSGKSSSPFSARILSKIPTPNDPKVFYDSLLLAWCLKWTDNSKVSESDLLLKQLGLLKRQGIGLDRILDLTFLPLEIFITCSDLSAYLTFHRRDLGRSLRSFRQRIRRGHQGTMTGPKGIEVEAPASLQWERTFLSGYGIDELTPEISRQIFWTFLFIPLVNCLQGHLPKGSHRKKMRIKDTSNQKPIIHNDAFKLASSLIALRYPSFWKDPELNWKRIRTRYFTLAQTNQEILP